MEEDGIDRRKEALLLSRNNLRNQSSQKRRQYRFRNPLQPRIVGQRFLTHEPVKFRKCDSVTEERSVFLSQSDERWQIGAFWRRNIPAGLYLRECMLGRRPPENVFGSIVIRDEWMLQAEPICNGANAGAMAAFRIEARVSSDRCCSALLRGCQRRPAGDATFAFFAIFVG